MMKHAKKGFLIGRVANRTGLSVSALRFYEEKGLLQSSRNAGGQRIYAAADIRRVSFIIVAQKLGFTLKRIKDVLDGLPNNRTPTAKDWDVIGQDFQADIDARIEALTRLKSKLSSCIGCGCLSLKTCALYNEDDIAREKGTGPRYLMGDTPEI